MYNRYVLLRDGSCAVNNSLPLTTQIFSLLKRNIFIPGSDLVVLVLCIEEELILVSVSAPQSPRNISCNLRQGTISNLPINRRNSILRLNKPEILSEVSEVSI